MGMMFAQVAFDGHAPPLADICSKITEICGRPVVVVESDPDEIHDLHATIAFECAPDLTLDFHTYRPGAVRHFCDETFDDAANSSLMKKIVQGANERAGTQTVYLRGYLG